MQNLAIKRLAFLLFFIASPLLADASGLQMSVAVDSYFKMGSAGDGRANHPEVRESEINIFAPIDHLFDGLLTIAAHAEDTGTFYELHEAYIRSTKAIPNTRFRIGQFFLGIGRLNRFHRHDWYFITSPKTHTEFFGDEGVVDAGAEASMLLPTPFFWDLTVGITRGWTFGHSHGLGELPKVPVHYVRSAHYADLPGDGGTEIGLNYLGRTIADGTAFQYAGLDGAAKWREGKILRWLIQSEGWARKQVPSGGASETLAGGYVFAQYGLTESWSVGLRADYFTNTSLADVAGNPIANSTTAIVPTVTWKPSEFSRFSVAYTNENTGRQAVECQATFVIGAHPAHLF